MSIPSMNVIIWVIALFMCTSLWSSGIKSAPAMYMKEPAAKGMIKGETIELSWWNDRAMIAPRKAVKAVRKFTHNAFFRVKPP